MAQDESKMYRVEVQINEGDHIHFKHNWFPESRNHTLLDLQNALRDQLRAYDLFDEKSEYKLYLYQKNEKMKELSGNSARELIDGEKFALMTKDEIFYAQKIEQKSRMKWLQDIEAKQEEIRKKIESQIKDLRKEFKNDSNKSRIDNFHVMINIQKSKLIERKEKINHLDEEYQNLYKKLRKEKIRLGDQHFECIPCI